MSWGQRAYEVINHTYHQQLTAGVTDKTAIAAAIDASYPFGERAMYPYKAWLMTRRTFFARHGLPLQEKRGIAKAAEQEPSLF